jgi:methylmalonyl-CoA mutase
MDSKENLFEEFPPISKAEWLAQAEEDLRGKPLSDLNWQLEEDIEMPPFFHPEDMDSLYPPLREGRPQNRWEVGEFIEVGEIPAANELLREGLEGGVEAPLLILHRPLKDEEIARLFEGIQPDLISTHFTQLYPGKDPAAQLRQFHQLVKGRSVDGEKIRGSIDYDPILDWSDPPFDDLAGAIRYCREHLPLFRALQINGLRFHAGPENTSRELAFLIAKGSAYLAQLSDRGIDPGMANQHLQLTTALSTSYFVEIAKLRALRLLWHNVLDAYAAAPGATLIVAHLARETQGDDPYTNMIKAGTQAMSAVIGGADRLYIRPANFSLNEPTPPLHRRIARNTQHLLRMESYLDRVIDPAAGSYYIEKLTEKLAEQAWEQFQELERERAFER